MTKDYSTYSVVSSTPSDEWLDIWQNGGEKAYEDYKNGLINIEEFRDICKQIGRKGENAR